MAFPLPSLTFLRNYEDLTDFGPVRLPRESYFVMGDHRISSNDSRVFGPVASHYIYGRAVFAYWPVDHFGSLSTRGSKNEMNFDGGTPERSAAPTRHTGARRRAHL